MRLNAAEQESFQKRLKIFFVNDNNNNTNTIKNSETSTIKNRKIINHFEKEGIAQNTIYDNLKRLETGQSFMIKSALVA